MAPSTPWPALLEQLLQDRPLQAEQAEQLMRGWLDEAIGDERRRGRWKGAV